MELREYIMPLRKWWWLIVAATLVATASSYLATRQQPAVYESRVTLMVGRAIENPNPSGADFYLTQQLAATYADIAKREPVQTATQKALGLSRLPGYTVRVVPNTQLIEIAVVDTHAQRAQAVANELGNQLILQTPTSTEGGSAVRQDFINAQLDDLQVKIKDTQEEIAKKQTDLAGMFSARQIADTQTQISGLQQKLNTLQANYAALLANTQKGAINTLAMIETAALPESPVGPNKAATIMLAAAIGFVLAAGAAYLLEYLDDSLKNPDDVQKALALTTLGAIPVVQLGEDGSELVMATNGHSAATEAYRVLRTNLQFAAVERPLRTLLVTSPSPTEGKSLTCANLGAALAQAGKRVVLVDADLHRPRLHRIFKRRNSVGLTTGLLDDAPAVSELLQETEIENLRVLTTGPLPPNPAELLGTGRMRSLLGELAGLCDIVVMDSPPAMALSDAAVLSTETDAVLLVLDAGRTRRELAKRALSGLQQVHAHVVGAVLNRMPARSGGYYYYYYHYGHYYGAQNGHGDGAGDKARKSKRSRKNAQPNIPTGEQELPAPRS